VDTIRDIVVNTMTDVCVELSIGCVTDVVVDMNSYGGA
jgi:hypothetical protein